MTSESFCMPLKASKEALHLPALLEDCTELPIKGASTPGRSLTRSNHLQRSLHKWHVMTT